jgi:hypothetical protein
MYTFEVLGFYFVMVMNDHFSLPSCNPKPGSFHQKLETTGTVCAYWIVCLGSTEKAFSGGFFMLSSTAAAVRNSESLQIQY